MVPPVVDLSWVWARWDEVVLADVRWYLDGRPGRAMYERGHLPGAVFVDLDRWLAGAPGASGGRHPLPDPEVFAAGMSSLGIGDATTVVGYDDAGGVVAARLVWLLRVTGHPAALLDGGLAAFGGPLETATPEVGPARFTPRPWPPQRLATIEDATDPAKVVLDARSPERYRGEEEPVDPRAGHIPGARSLPCRANLDADGSLLPVATLRRRFDAAGVAGDASVVSYCGSGVTACHTLVLLEHCGFEGGRLYPGSWSEYSRAPDRPAATGDPGAPGSMAGDG
ncbi:MAG TPA: sulfurtransferase [Acidimicrobiales bacterium]|nr:sulfurtransferase [Acidimicrobiales bacterium]